MLISPAYAQAPVDVPATTATTTVATDAGAVPAGAAGMSGLLPNLGLLVMLFGVFYFLLIRPQKKRMQQHQDMINAVGRGDKVATAGGVMGTVERIVDDNEIMLKVADGVTISVLRSSISNVLSSKAANDSGAKADKKSAKKAA